MRLFFEMRNLIKSRPGTYSFNIPAKTFEKIHVALEIFSLFK